MENELYLNIKTCEPFHKIGSYFRLTTFSYLPVWCSYSLHDILLAWEKTGGWIENEKGETIRFKPHIFE